MARVTMARACAESLRGAWLTGPWLGGWRLRLGLGAIASSGQLLILAPTPAAPAANYPAANHLTANHPTACPTDITALVDQLMLDLPNYSNRVIQRRRGHLNTPGSPVQLYSIAAGQAEIQPLASSPADPIAPTPPPELNPHRSRLPPLPATSSRHPNAAQPSSVLYEIFFTTLERQYRKTAQASFDSATTPDILQRATDSFQQFHWLILAHQPSPPDSPAPASNSPSSQAWQVISLRSQLAPYPSQERLLSPPRNALQGPISQAITLWLNDLQLSRRCSIS